MDEFDIRPEDEARLYARAFDTLHAEGELGALSPGHALRMARYTAATSPETAAAMADRYWAARSEYQLARASDEYAAAAHARYERHIQARSRTTGYTPDEIRRAEAGGYGPELAEIRARLAST